MKKLLLYSLFVLLSTNKLHAQNLPNGFVYVDEYIPNIAQDLKYYGVHNFIGKKINGYVDDKVILTKAATLALQKVQSELKKEGLAIKIYDAYRPQSAVNHFKKWASDIKDTLMRQEFYPTIDKRNLFKLGFIASKSGHSRGSTVDLTLIDISTSKELDMGSPFDYFGEQSAHYYSKLTSSQKKNRLKLKTIMEKHGFKPYNKEWWHYTLINEPFKETYFDFPVK